MITTTHPDGEQLEITEYDLCKIEDMEPGDKVTLECGGTVLCYKDSYTILFNTTSQQFKTVDEIRKKYRA